MLKSSSHRPSSPSTHRPPAPIAVLVLLAVVWLAGAPPSAAQGSANDLHFDWPVGQCVEGKRVFGHDYKIQQEFDNPRTNWSSGRCVSNYKCWHAGLDIHRTVDGSTTAKDPVFAMADGRVVGYSDDWAGQGDNNQGEMVILEHQTADGTVYTQYGHLDEVWVGENEPVRRGQPIGTVLSWPTGAANSHVHVELRSSLKVGYCPKTAPDNCDGRDYSLETERSCAGNGYSLRSTTASTSDLAAWGFLDPVDAYYAYRPQSPAWIAFDRATDRVRTMPEETAPQVPDRSIAVGDWFLSPAVDLNPPADATDTVDQAWYQLPTAEGADEEWVAGYDNEGYGALLRIGEAYRVGRQWSPPTSTDDRALLIDYRFEPANDPTCSGDGCIGRADQANCTCALGDSLINHGDDAAQGVVDGDVTLTVPYVDLLGNPDANEFCDLVGRFAGAGHVDLTPADTETNVHGGVAVELSTLLDAFTSEGEQILAGQWQDGDEQWKLAVTTESVVDDGVETFVGTLRFTVRQSTGVDLELSAPLDPPECFSTDFTFQSTCGDSADFGCDGSCDAATLHAPEKARCVSSYGYRQWTHVAAVYDTDDGEAELYWDGALLAQTDVSAQIAEGENPIRVGAGVSGLIDNVRIWARPAEPIANRADTVLVLDSSGSMRSNDKNDQRKNAARLFLNVVPGGDQVAAIDFDGSIQAANDDVKDVNVPAERDEVLAVIDGVDSNGLTNIGLALSKACDILERPSATNPFKAAILLTDGQDGVTNAEKQCFIDEDWSLHALGFGGAVQSQLDAIVADTGTRSTAEIVGSAEAVLCRMLQLRAELEGREALPCDDFEIQEGETIILDQQVDDVARITFSIAWPGSDVVMTLISPSGRVFDRGIDAPDVVHEVGPTYESYTIDCPEPGLWTIELYGADIPAGIEPVVYGTAEIEGKACAPVEACGTDALDAAGAFNAFVFGDLDSWGSESGGRLAAGGDIDLVNYGHGKALAPAGGIDVLVAGAHLRYRDGHIRGGDAVYGLSSDLDDSAVIDHGVLRQGTPIDFAAAEAHLLALATSLGALPATGATSEAWGKISLTGTEPGRNVFHVDASLLANAHTIVIDVPTDATALVVIDGVAVAIESAGVTLHDDLEPSQVLWVMPDAVDLRIRGIQLHGSVLAPRATVDFGNARLDGTLIGASFAGDGVLTQAPYAGCLPQP